MEQKVLGSEVRWNKREEEQKEHAELMSLKGSEDDTNLLERGG